MEPISPDTEFLYDLLYVDRPRVSSYLAQLDPNGTLTGIKVSSGQTTSISASGKVAAVIASGSVGGTDSTSEGGERQFDPIWALPITMLNRLDELNYVHRNLADTPIGGLVLVKGWLRLVDIRLIKNMWPAIGDLMKKQIQPADANLSRHQRRKTERSGPSETAGDINKDFIFKVVEHLPHAIEAHFVALNDGLAWCSLQPDQLLTTSDDVALKHGSALPGEWHMLAILDGQPGPGLDHAWEDIPSNDLSKAVSGLLTMIRKSFGRPDESYSVTPLMLFRTVAQRIEASLE